MTMERSRFSAAMMRSVEVGIQRSEGGHTRAHLDPACAGAASAVAAAAAAEAEAEARLISSAAILVVAATAARLMRRGARVSPSRFLTFPRARLDSGECREMPGLGSVPVRHPPVLIVR